MDLQHPLPPASFRPRQDWGAPATSTPVQTRVQLWAEEMRGGQGWEKANREKTETEAKEEGKGAFCLRLQSFLAGTSACSGTKVQLLGVLVGSQLPQPHLLTPGATRVYVVYAYCVG